MLKEIRSIHIDVEKGIYKINGEDIGEYHEDLEIELNTNYYEIKQKFPSPYQNEKRRAELWRY